MKGQNPWLQIVSKDVPVAEKSSFQGQKVSKILNWARCVEKLLSFYDADVINLQYFCGGKKIV